MFRILLWEGRNTHTLIGKTDKNSQEDKMELGFLGKCEGIMNWPNKRSEMVLVGIFVGFVCVCVFSIL